MAQVQETEPKNLKQQHSALASPYTIIVYTTQSSKFYCSKKIIDNYWG